MKNTSGIPKKLLVLGLFVVFFILGLISAPVLLNQKTLEKSSGEELTVIAERNLSLVTENMHLMLCVQNEMLLNELKTGLTVAQDSLDQKGAVSLSGDETIQWKAINQYTQETSEISLPAMYAGDFLLSRTSDADSDHSFVDKVQDMVGASCTLFQRMNAEGDMLRVSTNIRNDAGKRALGTFIPARNPDGVNNPVVETVLKGEIFTGRAFVVNRWYLTRYQPMYNEAKEIVGMLFVGILQDKIDSLRTGIEQVVVGKTGRVIILEGPGDNQGQCLISNLSSEKGKNLWEVPDVESTPYIQGIVQKAVAQEDLTTLAHFQIANEPNQALRMMGAARYFKPWNWIIVSIADENDF